MKAHPGGVQIHGNSACEPCPSLVKPEGGRRDQDLVAGVEDAGQRAVNGLRCTGGDEDLVRPVVKLARFCLIGGEFRTERSAALVCGVVGTAACKCADGGLAYGCGRGKIRLADGQRDAVLTLRGESRIAANGTQREPAERGAEPVYHTAPPATASK